MIIRLDPVIEIFLGDPDYKVKRNGQIWTRISRSGKPFADAGRWRRCDFPGTNGNRVRYNGYRLPVSRIVYRKYGGKLEPKLVVDHKDGNRFNDKFSNLQQITQAENNRKARTTKLNHKTALKIKSRYLRGGITQRALAEKYGVSQTHVHRIVKELRWRS